MTYHFRHLKRDDKDILTGWLQHPHINGWWGAPKAEWALIEDDLDHPDQPTDMRIVEFDGTPFAYLQDYRTDAFPNPQYDGFSPGSRAMDTFLGDPAYLGKGHATGYLIQRSNALLANAPLITVDPDPKNARAIRTYERAGFTHSHTSPCEDGDLVYVMTKSSPSS